ncbi:MAG: hypothetical protein GQ530_03295 [Desulfuromonadales bacterium]|nr:hypothetical protein [Desulfuromonadales bacterium]
MNKHFVTILLFLLCLLVSSPVEAGLTPGVLIDTDEFASQAELQHVPPLRPGRAWVPQEESVYRDTLPGEKSLAKKLVLGVVPDPKGLVQTSEQAEQLAAYLEEVLPVSVSVRDSTHLEIFTEWFMRHRMIDIAVLSPAIAKANLGRDYQPVAILFRTVKTGLESAELVVIRRGQTEEVRAQLQRVFLDMAQTAEGQTLMAALKINDVLVPDGALGQLSIVAQPPAAGRALVMERQKPAAELAVEAVEEPVQELMPLTPADAEPVEPFAPPEVIVKTLPELPETSGTTPILPFPEMPDVALLLPVPAMAPVEPVAGNEQQKIIAEVLEPADAVSAHELPGRSPVVVDENEYELRDDEIIALLGENSVAAMIAQPDIPLELRPPGIPIVRPGFLTRRTTVEEDELLVASIPEPRKKTEPPRLPKLLPEQEPEPGIIYVVPFVAVMVPLEVNARIFDQFVDTLNQEGEALGLQFVILKKGLRSVDPEWLSVRKYVTGEIYAYVEDSGSNWTELRSKVHLTYRQPNQNVPVFSFESPAKRFFDHDRSTIDIERIKLSDDISATLSSALLKVLRN